MTMWKPTLDDDSVPVYRAIVAELERDIDSGSVRADDKLPTHRELADALGVAVGTVTRAYALAERQGLIRGETGRGTFVGPRDDPTRLLQRPGASSGLVDCGMSWPMYAKDPDLASALRALAGRADLAELQRYQSSTGMTRHCEAGAKWVEAFGVRADPATVVVCAGSQHAMNVIFSTVTAPGDVILAEELTYPGLRGAAELQRVRLAPVSMDEEGLIPEALEDACVRENARVLYTVPTLQNPTTAVMSDRRRRDIAAVARAHDLIIVEDDVHHLLIPDSPPALASYAPERTYLIAGMSKMVSGGLRISFVVTPPPAANVERLGRSIWSLNYMIPPLNAEIAAMWIDDGTAMRTVRRKRSEAAARVSMAERALAGFDFRRRAGGYHLWLRLPERWDSTTFAFDARNRGVVVTPAEAFSVKRDARHRAVRVCLSAVETRDEWRAALTLLRAALEASPAHSMM